MGALRRNIATLLVVTMICGLLPLPAMAHRMTERVYDPSTGDTFRQVVPHRHRADGTVVILDGSVRSQSVYDNYSYSPYSTYYSSPYYSSSSYRPYGYYGGYNDYGYRRSSGSSIAPALLGAGLGYAIGRSSRRR